MSSDSDRIVDLYERNARNYVVDRRSAGWDESAWLDRFIALLPEEAAILDIGCGCGEPIARYFIDRNFTVEGVDASPSLVSLCRERFPNHGVAMGSYHGEPLYHASLAAEEYRGLLEANGFRVAEHVSEDPNCGRHTIWLAQAAK